MSHHRPFTVLIACLASLVVVAPASAGPNADSHPGVSAGEVAEAGQALGPAPDRHIDVAKVRGISARTASRSTASRTAVAGKALDMKILLLSADGSEPTYHWWRDALTSEGVPFDTIIGATAPELTASRLRVSVDHGRYQAIVLATGGLAYSPDGGSNWASALSSSEWAVLQAYELEFGVREVNAYAYPQPAYGLEPGANGSDMSGVTARLAPAGADVFTELLGPVPIDRWSWGYQGTPAAGSSWRTLVSGPAGAIVGTYARTDGTEAIVNTVDTNEWSLHGHALFGGMLEWATRGVHLGVRRNYLGIDVDDVFLPDDRWKDSTRPIRMNAADVERAVAWQTSSGLRLNMLFNGEGASATDPLTQALLARKHDFRWTSHTWSHSNLDAADVNQIKAEIWKNADFANDHGIPFDPTELTTGEHSGLGNPAMAQALIDTGVKWFGADASRQPAQYELGGALSVPRHPTGIYYNVGTFAEQLDEYNFINHTACPAGNLGCLHAPADWSTYVANEATMILRHVLDNDPRPHYVHQSNLAEDGTLYPVVDEVLERYRSLFKAELVQPGTRQTGVALQRMAAWRAAVAGGSASGTITGTGSVVVHSSGSVPVPVTGTTVGESYGGVRSGWVTPPAPAPAPKPEPEPTGSGQPFALWPLDGGTTQIADTVDGRTGYWRNGPAAFAEGVTGDAALFNGSPLYGEINGVHAPQTAYTLEAWVRTSDRSDAAIVEHGAAGALALIGGRLTFRNVSTDIRAGWTVEPRLWYHVAGVWSGGAMRLYVDGQLAASGTSSQRPSGAATLYLGRGAIAPSLEGRLDEVAYYDHALTAEQLASHTSAGHHPAARAPASEPAAPAAEPVPVPVASRTTTATTAPKTAKARARAKARKAKARKAKARRAKTRRAATRRT